MPSFRNAKSQAKHAIKQKLGIKVARHTHRDDQKIHSLGTARNYETALIRLTEWLQQNRLGDLKNLNATTALQYLELRGQSVGQKTLDQERQAIQMHLGIKLPVIKSELSQALKSRAYTHEQILLIAKSQKEPNRLATEIAFAAGLRAHELLTLLPVQERSASNHRQWSPNRFSGQEGRIYTVIGKGGLIREVLIPESLSRKLEMQRLNSPITIKDREIKYQCYYKIGGGKSWTNSFSAASKRILGWSHGAHGVRHNWSNIKLIFISSIPEFL